MRHDKGCTTIHFSGKCPRPQKTKSTQKEPQIRRTVPAFELSAEQAKALNKASKQLAAEIEKAQSRMVEAVTDMLCDMTNALKAQREAFGPKEPEAKPEPVFPSGEAIRNMVAEFREAWDGKFCDTSGVYGPQAPDLIAEYVRYLTRHDTWRFPEVYAGQFAKTEDPHIAKHFEQMAAPMTSAGRVGDIVIAASPDGCGYIGIVTTIQLGKTLQLFTQSPIFPAGDFPVGRNSIIGVWRPRTND